MAIKPEEDTTIKMSERTYLRAVAVHNKIEPLRTAAQVVHDSVDTQLVDEKTAHQVCEALNTLRMRIIKEVKP